MSVSLHPHPLACLNGCFGAILQVGIEAGLDGPSTVLVVGRLKDASQVGNPSGKTAVGVVVDVTDYRVPVGATSFSVSDASSFSPGDEIYVHWYANDGWIAASKCDTHGIPRFALNSVTDSLGG